MTIYAPLPIPTSLFMHSTTNCSILFQLSRTYATKQRKPNIDKKITPRIDPIAESLAVKGCVHTVKATAKLALAAILPLQRL